MSQCNYCDFKYLKKRKEKQGFKLLIEKAECKIGGVDIYQYKDKVEEKEFVVWYMRLPDRCLCD